MATSYVARTGGLFTLVLGLLVLLGPAMTAQAQPLDTAFTYQGQLQQDGAPVDDTCDFRFLLYDQPTGGSQIGNTQTISDVQVVAGYFDVALDFGSSVFDGAPRYLDIAVRCGAETNFSVFGERVRLRPTPYALHAGQVPWSGLTDVPAGLDDGDDNTTYTTTLGLTLNGTTLSLDTAFTNARYWQLGGNTSPLTPTLGTTDSPTLTLVVSSTTALRLDASGDVPTLLGGAASNTVTNGAIGVVIAGGGPTDPADVTNTSNAVYDNYGTIGGGGGNRAGSDDTDRENALYATVGGGYANEATGDYTAVGGGYANEATGDYTAVGGGYANEATGSSTTVGGGFSNAVAGSSSVVAGGFGNNIYDNYSTVGGGFNNSAGSDNGTTSDGDYATVAGGYLNTASEDSSFVGGGYANEANGYISTISGGSGNIVQGEYGTIGGGGSQDINNPTATGNKVYDDYGTVGGGSDNQAGSEGVATNDAPYATVGGGQGNTASQDYATVPGGRDNTASGIYSFAAGRAAIANNTGAFVWADNLNQAFFSLANNSFRVRSRGGVQFVTAVNPSGGATAGVRLLSGSSSWDTISDRNAKTAFAPIDHQTILERVAGLPIASWQYRSQDASIRHIGPMAQDFYAAFGLGTGDTTINTVDADGVALAAIQGLHAQNQEQAEHIADLEAENADLQTQVDDLEARLSALEAALNDSEED
jgi:hypothetical protein